MIFKDRKDGKKVKNIDGVHNIMCYLKPYRCDSDVYINETIDVTELVKYMNEKKKEGKYTYFHAFSTAIAKVVYNRPLLNRFVANKTFYDRNEVTLSFVAKVDFTDEASEYLSKIKVEPNDNINDINKKIVKKVSNVRSNKKNKTDDTANIVGKLPRLLRAIVINALMFMDKHGWLPKSMIDDNIYYSTVILSNLGSIDCGSIYHNLTNFGTNSILLTIGKIRKAELIMENGKKEIRDVCDFGINLDERIADGVYFAKSINLFKYILQHPELLEENANEKVEIQK